MLKGKDMDIHSFTEHPEGGRFKEIFRSTSTVTGKGRTRSALTHIYFSLNADEVSRFHRVDSDEIWNLYQGDGIHLYTWDNQNKTMETTTLSAEKKDFCHVIRAGLWQAAQPVSSAVLVGCSVAPGFEFDDFQMIDEQPVIAGNILDRFPGLSRLVLGKS